MKCISAQGVGQQLKHQLHIWSLILLARILLLIAFFTFISADLMSQSWSETGATWHFGRTVGWIPFQQGHQTWSYEEDTLIINQSCDKLSGFYDYYTVELNSDTTFGGHLEQDPLFLYTQNDSSYFYYDDAFHLWAPYNAEIGDTWTSPIVGWENPSEYHIEVIDLSQIEISSIIRRRLHVILSYDYDGLNYSSDIHILTEGIQWATGYILPVFEDFTGIIDINETSILNCYSSTFGGVHQFTSDCSPYPITAVSEHRLGVSSISPNPAQDFVSIDLNIYTDLVSIVICDLSGRVVLSTPFSSRLDISDLESAVYLLRILNDYGVIHTEKLIVE